MRSALGANHIGLMYYILPSVTMQACDVFTPFHKLPVECKRHAKYITQESLSPEQGFSNSESRLKVLLTGHELSH